jgi:putative ABC transport system permease protein
MRFPLWRRRQDEDLDEEIRNHLQMAMRDHVDRGQPAEEAHRSALREFGNVALVKEVTRDMWGWTWLERLAQDVRFGLRLLRRSPGFTALAVLTLGVALGASAIMFSIINGVLLLPLPYRDSNRLVRLYTTAGDGKNDAVSALDFIDWARQARSFEGIAAIHTSPFETLNDRDFPEQIVVMAVSSEFFRLLGALPAMGRLFQPGDFVFSNRDGRNSGYDGAVAVLSYGLWQSRYGSDQNLIGHSISIEGKSVKVVGVAAPDFQFSAGVGQPKADCWVSSVFGEKEDPRFRSLMVIGRTRKDVTLGQAQAEMNAIASGIKRTRPKTNANRSVRLLSLHESMVGNVRRQLLVLFGAVAFVLLIACSNIANLLLARAATRQKEIAVRSSVGASRWRLMRQLLTESVLLCLLGGLAGILLALCCKNAIIALAPEDLPRVDAIVFDAKSFAFMFLSALLTGVLCGVVPALRASRMDLTEALKDGTLSPMGSRRGWLGHGLVTAQISLTLMLLIASGLMIRTYARLHAVPLGFDAANVIVFNARPPLFKSQNYRRLDAWTGYCESVAKQIQRIPGVDSAAMGALPIKGAAVGMGVYVEGQDKVTSYNSVSTTSEYFRVIGARLLEGRLFNESDRADSLRVAIVNQSVAQRLWPGSNPIGKRFAPAGREKPANPEWIQVIGLVADVRMSGLEGPPVPFIYIPMSQSQGAFSFMALVRITTSPSSLVPLLRKALQNVDRDAALGKIETIEEILDSKFAERRFNLLLISVFGGLAFVLATIGIYGTIAYSVSRRTHEIGIRMALGAQAGNVLRLLIRQGLWMLTIGEAIGLAGALALNKLLSSMVFGVTTTDALTYIVVSLTWAAVAILASFLPARRATWIDPMLALRCE